MIRRPYPSDVSDDEWALVSPYLTLLPEGAAQREHPIREVFNGLRYVVKTGAPWRWMPNDLPPWAAVYQQAQRWLAAGSFEALAADLRAVLRLAAGRKAEPSAAIIAAGRCDPRPRAARGRDTTGPSARRAPSCTSPWTSESAPSISARTRLMARRASMPICASRASGMPVSASPG